MATNRAVLTAEEFFAMPEEDDAHVREFAPAILWRP